MCQCKKAQENKHKDHQTYIYIYFIFKRAMQEPSVRPILKIPILSSRRNRTRERNRVRERASMYSEQFKNGRFEVLKSFRRIEQNVLLSARKNQSLKIYVWCSIRGSTTYANIGKRRPNERPNVVVCIDKFSLPATARENIHIEREQSVWHSEDLL
jgi:hypothetical protein